VFLDSLLNSLNAYYEYLQTIINKVEVTTVQNNNTSLLIVA
jgi:hypothetical protein